MTLVKKRFILSVKVICEERQMGQIIFWGAGRTGQNVLDFWKMHQMCPDFFADNDKKLWGKEIGNVKVLSPQEIYSIRNIKIFITSQFSEEILNQLLENGIPEEKIVRADHIYRSEMIREISDILSISVRKNAGLALKKECLIDLSKGMVLGGVERWSYTLAGCLKEAGFEGAYILPGCYEKMVSDDTFPSIIVDAEEKYMLDLYVENILHSGCKYVICNFPHTFFLAVCMIKKKKLSELRIITVIHNDESIYYDTYCNWSRYIDMCLVISRKMRTVLAERGFPSEKIRELHWKIPCKKELKRDCVHDREPIHIGYAGRVTKIQKRADLIVDVAEKLKRKRIDFTLQIAGTGDYEETLKEEIMKHGLGENVVLKGLVDNKNISGFWQDQDICINCSEWEGHSISQCEAMAAGAVPVVTDTSGAEDDIIDGYNGYIVGLCDVDAMADRIEFLYRNRERLFLMGVRSQKMIIERNKNVDEIAYWRELLT